MLLFGGKKTIERNKIMDTVNMKRYGVNIDEAITNTSVVTGRECIVLYEDDFSQYLQFKTHYLLYRDKKEKNKAIYLGVIGNIACYYKGKVVTASSREILMRDHSLVFVDCFTGKRSRIDFIDKGKILGFDMSLCLDRIVKITAEDHRIIVTVRRERIDCTPPVTTPYNDDFEYNVCISYKDGQYTIDPVTPESITQRGPWGYRVKHVFRGFGELTDADLGIIPEDYKLWERECMVK